MPGLTSAYLSLSGITNLAANTILLEETSDVLTCKQYLQELEYDVEYEVIPSSLGIVNKINNDGDVINKNINGDVINFNKLLCQWPISEKTYNKERKLVGNNIGIFDTISASNIDLLTNGFTYNNTQYAYNAIQSSGNVVDENTSFVKYYFILPSDDNTSTSVTFQPYVPNTSGYMEETKIYESIPYYAETVNRVTGYIGIDNRTNTITSGTFVEWYNENISSTIDYTMDLTNWYLSTCSSYNDDYNTILNGKWSQISGEYTGQNEITVKNFLYNQLLNKLTNKYNAAKLKQVGSYLVLPDSIFKDGINGILDISHNYISGQIITSGVIYDNDTNTYSIQTKVVSENINDIKPEFIDFSGVELVSSEYEYIKKEEIEGDVMKFFRNPAGKKIITSGVVLNTADDDRLIMTLSDTKINDVINLLIDECVPFINDVLISGYIINTIPETITGYITGSVFTHTNLDISINSSNSGLINLADYTYPKINYFNSKKEYTLNITHDVLDEWNDYYASYFANIVSEKIKK